MNATPSPTNASPAMQGQLNPDLRLYELTEPQLEMLDAKWHTLNPDVIECDSIRTRINNNREWVITVREFLAASVPTNL